MNCGSEMDKRKSAFCHVIKAFVVPILIILLFLTAGTLSAKNNLIKIKVDTVWTDGTTEVLGTVASFPYSVLSRMKVYDEKGYYYPRLAIRDQWAGLGDKSESGEYIDELWHPVYEYHSARKDYPTNPNVKAQSQYFGVTEVRMFDYTLSLAVVMDYSRSIDDVTVLEEATVNLVNELGGNDSLAVVKFSDEIKYCADFTNDKEALTAIIRKDNIVRIGTSLYSAVDTAVQHIKYRPGRRVVVVYTDGKNDHQPGNLLSLDEMIKRAKDNNVELHVIGIGGGIDEPILKQMARETDGKYYYGEAASSQKLSFIYLRIYGDLRGYYVTKHMSTDPFHNGTWRDVDINLWDGWRDGQGVGHYYVPDYKSDVVVRKSVITDSTFIHEGQVQPIATSSDTVFYSITIANEGVGAHPAVNVADVLSDSLTLIPASIISDPHITLGQTGAQQLNWSVPRLDVGDAFTITYSVRLDPLMPMDPAALNNRVTLTSVQPVAQQTANAVVYGIGYPDLAVVCETPAVIGSPTQPVPIQAQIRNTGTAHIDRPFRVAFMYEGQILDYDTLAVLNVGQSLTAHGIVQFDERGVYTIEVMADVDQAIQELNENNNSDQCDLTLDITNLEVQISDISYKDVFKNVRAKFPDVLLTKVNVLDQNRYPVSDLADTEQWLTPDMTTKLGSRAGDIWQMLREWNTGNPLYPSNPDIQSQIHVTEIKESTINLSLLIGRDWPSGDYLAFVKDQLDVFIQRKQSADRMAVMSFDDDLVLLQPHTAFRNTIQSAVQGIQLNTGSRIYDALYDAVETAGQYASRNALLLVGGMKDNGSTITPAEVTRKACEYGVPVFILLTQPNLASTALEEIAQQTGGQIVLFSNESGFREGLASHERLMRHYYMLSHPSPDTLKNQTWRSLNLKIEAFSMQDADTSQYLAPIGIHDLAIDRSIRTSQHRLQQGDTLWTAQPGDSIRVTVIVENSGDYTMINTEITDSLPPNLIPELSFAAVYSKSDAKVTWQIPSMAAGERKVYTYSCFVDTLPNLEDLPLYSKVLLFSAEDENPINNMDCDTLLYEPLIGADIIVSKFAFADSMSVSGNDTLWYAHPESLVKYQVSLMNRGEMPCLDVELRDVLPPFMSFISADIAPRQSGDTLIWNIERVNGHRESVTISYTCKMDSLMPPWDQTLTNLAIMTCKDDQMDYNNTSQDSVTALGLRPSDPVIQVSPQIIPEGEPVQFTVLAPFSVKSWDLEVVLANGEIIKTYADSFIASHLLQPNIPLVAQPDFIETMKRTTNHEETVQAILVTTDLFDVVRNDTAEFIITLPDLQIIKSAKTDSMSVINGDTTWLVKPRGIIEYQVKMSNLGRVGCQNIRFQDVLPSQTTLIKFFGTNPYTYRDDTLAWNVDQLGAFPAEQVFRYSCRVDSVMPPWNVDLVNMIHAACDNDYDPANNAAGDTVTAVGISPPGPRIDVNPGIIEPGDSVQICVMSPFTVTSWDIVTLYADGSTTDNYADAFIGSNVLTPNEPLCITPRFTDTAQRTTQHEEPVGFVLITEDVWNVTRTDTAYCTLTTPDLVIWKFARTDSMAVVQGDTLWIVRPDKMVEYTVTVENRSQIPCNRLQFTDIIPSQMTFVSFAGNTAYTLNQDTLKWTLASLAGNTNPVLFSYSCRVDADMPPRIVEKRNLVAVMGHREYNPADNSTSALIYVAGYVPPDPTIWTMPPRIEPFDSVQVRVTSPIVIRPGFWNVTFVFADGSTITDYADPFIQSNDLMPGDTLLLRPVFEDTRMRSTEKEERVTVVLETIDHWNTSFFDTTWFDIKAGDAFWLDENVFRIGAGNPLGFRFQISTNRNAKITIYDISGAYIRTIADGPYYAGWNRVVWDGRDEPGNLMGSGLYVAIYESGDFKKVHKFIVVR